jgi:hypothetical protein
MVLLTATILFLLLFLLLRYIGKQEQIRIVRDSGGALMALNAPGLRELHELYSFPKACTEDFGKSETDAGVKGVLLLKFCNQPAPPITRQMVKEGIVLIPGGTRAIVIGRSFILPGGRLVDPYSANTYDMARDGAVEVERIRITQPPNENLEGWVASGLGRVCCGL